MHCFHNTSLSIGIASMRSAYFLLFLLFSFHLALKMYDFRRGKERMTTIVYTVNLYLERLCIVVLNENVTSNRGHCLNFRRCLVSDNVMLTQSLLHLHIFYYLRKIFKYNKNGLKIFNFENVYYIFFFLGNFYFNSF